MKSTRIHNWLLLAMGRLAFGWGMWLMLSIGLAQEPPAVGPGEAEPVVIADVEAVEVIVEEPVELVNGMLGEGQDPQIWLLQRYVRVNSALARRVSQLSDPEEHKLSQLTNVWIDKQVKESIASPARAVAAGIARFLGGGVVEVQNLNGDPQQLAIPKVKKRIDAAIEECLEPEHREAFVRERESQIEFRKQATAAVLVAVVDEHVFLTQQQREQLEPEVAKWLTADLYWQFYFQNSNYVPDIPKRVLSKVLTADQLGALQGSQAWNYEMAQMELQMLGEAPVMIAR